MMDAKNTRKTMAPKKNAEPTPPLRATSTTDAAVALRTSPSSIKRWCRQGAPHTRDGRDIAVNVEELQRWRDSTPHGNTGNRLAARGCAMTLDRNLAHAVLSSAALVSSAELERTAHDIVDNLWGVIDVVAKQAAAQELQHQRHARGLGVGSWEGVTGPAPSRSPPPSNETESERQHERQTLALESIADFLKRIASEITV